MNILPSLAVGIFGIYTADVGNGMNRAYTIAFEVFVAILALDSTALYIILKLRKDGLDFNPFQVFCDAMYVTQRMDGTSSIRKFIEEIREEWKNDARRSPVPVPEENDLEQQPVKVGSNFDEISVVELDKYFGPRRFRLERRPGDHSTMLYALDDPPVISPPTLWTKMTDKLGVPLFNRFCNKHLWSDAHPMVFQTIPLTVYATLLIALFVIAAGQPFWAEDSPFFYYIGSRRFARSALAQVVNTVIWLQIDNNAHMMHPFYQLRKNGGSGLQTPVSDYMFKEMFDAIREITTRWYNGGRGQPKVNLKLEDFTFLSIIVGNFAGWFFALFWNIIAFGYSPLIFAGLLCTEALMVTSMAFIWLYLRTPILPRQPVTIASLLMYTYASNFNIRHMAISYATYPDDVIPPRSFEKFCHVPFRYFLALPTSTNKTPPCETVANAGADSEIASNLNNRRTLLANAEQGNSPKSFCPEKTTPENKFITVESREMSEIPDETPSEQSLIFTGSPTEIGSTRGSCPPETTSEDSDITVESQDIPETTGETRSEESLVFTNSPRLQVNILDHKPTPIPNFHENSFPTAASPAGSESTDDRVQSMSNQIFDARQTNVTLDEEDTGVDRTVNTESGGEERIRIQFGFGRFTVDGKEHVGIALYNTVTPYEWKRPCDRA
ncbi:hypothetical protein FPQ18DRAFT_305639 [Pyronema domesticum]|nr:hypothetical protein FPQ18DRAFT_305639 [Pyronema domesticum]